MKFFKLAAATAIVLATASVASAQSAAPQIPSPVNPAPLNPIATDGSSLPYAYVPAEGVRTGRSVGFDNGGLIGAPLGFASGVVGAATGVVGSVVNSAVSPFDDDR